MNTCADDMTADGLNAVIGDLKPEVKDFSRGDSRLAAVGSVAFVSLPSRPFVFRLLVGPWQGQRRSARNRRVFGRLGQLLQVNGGIA